LERVKKTKLAVAPTARFALPKKQTGVLSEETRQLVLEHTERLFTPPTAPYAEDALVAIVRDFVKRVPGFELRADRYQNLLVKWKGNGSKQKGPGLAFSAHLDHPGFLYKGTSKGVRTATFHGGVPESYFVGSRVRFYDGKSFEACATARIKSTSRDQDRLIVAHFDQFVGTARKGMFGMWDLTPGTLAGSRFHARVCDDLIGAAALLTTLEELAKAKHPEPVMGIFTRAEETGFIGCQGLLRSKAIKGDWSVIGLECSPKRVTAKVGKGPVIRVGDAGTIFDPALTHLLQGVAADLRREHEDFVFQRALMDGGRCESTAYNMWGVPAGGLCLALGNYHNCAPNGSIEPEYVNWQDYEGLVALMLGAAKSWRGGAKSGNMQAGLDRIWKRERTRLEESASRIRAMPASRTVESRTAKSRKK
jgi:putative aminopeptidase FrvX